MIRDYAKEPRVDVIVPRRPRFAMILAMFALGLIAVFIVVLLSLNPDHQIEEPRVVQVDLVVPIEKADPIKPMLTEQPTKPNFTFQVILKQTEVKPAHVKIYESTPKDPNKKTSNLLQVASFKSKSDAKALQKRLIRKQLPNVQVTQSTSDSGSV